MRTTHWRAHVDQCGPHIDMLTSADLTLTDTRWPVRTTHWHVDQCGPHNDMLTSVDLTLMDTRWPVRTTHWQVRTTHWRTHVDSCANFNCYTGAVIQQKPCCCRHSRPKLLQLYLSAAFNTVDKQQTVWHWLDHTFSTHSTPYKWTQSVRHVRWLHLIISQLQPQQPHRSTTMFIHVYMVLPQMFSAVSNMSFTLGHCLFTLMSCHCFPSAPSLTISM